MSDTRYRPRDRYAVTTYTCWRTGCLPAMGEPSRCYHCGHEIRHLDDEENESAKP